MPIINSIEEIILTSGGGTTNLLTTSGVSLYIVTGTATLTSSWTIQPSGTPTIGMTYSFLYKANINLNGENITIFGETLPENLSNKEFKIEAVWNGTTWIVSFLADVSEDGVIPLGSLEDYNISDKDKLISVPISFESGEQGKQVVTFPFFGDFKIHGVWINVTKNIEATNPALITLYEETTATVITTTLGSYITIPAGSVAGALTGYDTAYFTSFITHTSGGAYLTVETYKLTPGGKATLYFLIRTI